MQPAQITLSYKQVIDAHSTGEFETKVFEDSYIEFLMQSQAYNLEKKYRTFSELKVEVPKSNSLHYKVGFAIGLFVQELGHRMPGVTDVLGSASLPFESYVFEIIDSDILDREQHRVSITYTTPVYTLLGLVGERLLLLSPEQSEADVLPATFMFTLSPQLIISSYKALQLQPQL